MIASVIAVVRPWPPRSGVRCFFSHSTRPTADRMRWAVAEVSGAPLALSTATLVVVPSLFTLMRYLTGAATVSAPSRREKNPGALNADAADQLIEVVHTYLK